MPQRASAISSVGEDRVRRNEIAPQLDVEPGLLECLADRTCNEVLARLDSAARRSPDTGGEMRLADQRKPACRVENQERHIVCPRRVVRRDRPFGVGDLSLPRQLERRAEMFSHHCKNGVSDVHL
jgi:hypothetical protein